MLRSRYVAGCLPSNAYADRYYVGPDGIPTSEPHNIRLAVGPLLDLYEDLPAVDFESPKLKAVRDRMIELGFGEDSDQVKIADLRDVIEKIRNFVALAHLE